MIFLLRYWKHAIALSCALAIIVGIAYILILRSEVKNLKSEISRLDEQVEIAALEINQCSKDKALTEKVSNDYQKSIANLRYQLNGLRDDPRCVPVQPPASTDGHNGAATGAIVSGRSGLRTGYLIDLGGRCEETRLKLIGCQKFINQTWESRNVKN